MFFRFLILSFINSDVEFTPPIEDTLKTFEAFKNKQKAYEVLFLICKSIYILKVYPIYYKLR